MIKNIIGILILLIAASGIGAQSVNMEKEARKLFPVATSISGLNLYGYVYGSVEIQLFLFAKDDEWKGYCYYPSSQEKYRLDGGKLDEKIILDEYDSRDKNIGTWQIDVKNKSYKAKWKNVAGIKMFTMNMKELNKQNKLLENRKNTIRIYNGKIINDDFQIILTDDFDHKNKIELLNLNENKYLKHSLECYDDICNSFIIRIKNDRKLKKIICKKKGNNSIEILAFDKFGTKFKSEIQEINKLELADKSYINKKYSLNIRYPIFNNKKSHDSFNKELDLMVDSLEEEMEKIFFDKYDIDERQVLQASGWFDIDYYSDNIFSARFIIQKSYSEKTICIPVVFSLKTGKKIKIYNQFSSDFNFKFFKDQYLKENIKKLPDYKSTMIRNYLKPDNFKYLTINQAGIVASTEFNSIFGIYKIIIPYSDIKKNIKRRSILQKIIKL